MFKSSNISNSIFSCASYLGRQDVSRGRKMCRQDVSRGRKQEINIGSGCDYRSTTVHEVIDRNSHPGLIYKRGAIKNFAKFAGEDLCRSPFFNNVADSLFY